MIGDVDVGSVFFLWDGLGCWIGGSEFFESRSLG